MTQTAGPAAQDAAAAREVLAREEETAQSAISDSLERASPFASLPPDALRWLAERLQPVRFEPGESILHRGEPGDAFYLVRDGRVAVLGQRPDGTEYEIDALCAGEPFGELALLSGEPHSATVRAL